MKESNSLSVLRTVIKPSQSVTVTAGGDFVEWLRQAPPVKDVESVKAFIVLDLPLSTWMTLSEGGIANGKTLEETIAFAIQSRSDVRDEWVNKGYPWKLNFDVD